MDIRNFLDEIRMPQGVNYNTATIVKLVIAGIFGILLLFGIVTSIYTVPTDSKAVVKRFGKWNRTTEPGIRIKIPFGVESATAVPVRKVQKEEFGFRTLKAGIDSLYLGVEEIDTGRVPSDSLYKLIQESGERVSGRSSRLLLERAKEILRGEYIMLTGDLNIIDVQWIVQYKIKDAKKYLFNVRKPAQTIRDASQAVMRLLIGNGSVDEAITIGRIDNENSAATQLQTFLDEYETGIDIVTVKLQSCHPPFKVRPAFNEVNKAQQQKEQRINEAKKEYNEAIPKTEGQAKKLIETAKGYAAERVNMALGDIAKFDKIYTEYKEAPDITRQRMYLETMAKVLPQIPEKWFIEQGGAEGGILMRLDLEKQK